MASDLVGIEGARGKSTMNTKVGSSTKTGVAINLPEKFREMERDGGDVARVKGRDMMYQSIFDLVPRFADRSRHGNFQSRFDDEVSESEDDSDERRANPAGASTGVGKDAGQSQASNTSDPRDRRKGSLFKSVAQLKRPRHEQLSEDAAMDRMSSSQILPPKQVWKDAQECIEEESKSEDDDEASSHAPMLSRMLTAEAEMKASQVLEQPHAEEEALAGLSRAKQQISLSGRLQQMFAFDEAENVVAEFPCWFLQTVLLQGYMYITQQHVCFYAYLPKKDADVSKSGHFQKRQRTGYRRFFFELRGDYLTYYTDPSKKIFPYSHIDLRYAISALVEPIQDKVKEGCNFSLTTSYREYHFRADSAESAKSWVRQLQRVILRLSNSGDSVKIALPIENILNVESNQSLDFAETIKIQVIDNQETFAIDDFLFSFFSHGEEAYGLLKDMVEENQHRAQADVLVPPSPPVRVSSDSRRSRQHSVERGRASARPLELPKTAVPDDVRSTLAPINTAPTGRLSPTTLQSNVSALERKRDFSGWRSRSSRASQRSLSPIPAQVDPHSPQSSKRQDSSDSVSRSMAQETESSAALQSLDDTDASASKMLEQSMLFQTPTMQKLEQNPSTSSVRRSRRGSDDTARSHDMPKDVHLKHGVVERTQGSNLTSPSTPLVTGEPSTERPPYRRQQQPQRNQSYVREIVRAAANPMQTTTEVTQYLTKRSKDMSSLLASESMGYYEKVSGMWAGKRKHYDAAPGTSINDEVMEEDDEQSTADASERFRAYFALHEKEQLKAIYFASIQRVLPLYGKVYIGVRHFCFRSLLPGTRFKVVLPFDQVEAVNKERGYRPGHPGVVIVIRAFEELFFEFSRKDDRDDCMITLLQSVERARYMQGSTTKRLEGLPESKQEYQLLQEARQDSHAEHDPKLPTHAAVQRIRPDAPSIFFDDPRASILNFKPTGSLNVMCLTIGSRGDVQPYIALCKGLIAEGHKPVIATHAEFGPWITSHGVGFAPIEGDPAELMRICIENGMFTVNFLREATSKFRGWLDGLLLSAWHACQGADLLIESPSAMAGIHIAEALEIPYMRAFSMPWTRTRAYPHAFGVPERRMGGYYNYMTYVMFDRVFWKAIAGQINSWRKKELNLGATNYDRLQSNKVPFLYFYSPSVVPPPADYSEWIRITGYWFLDVDKDFRPPSDIVEFVARARRDGKKVVYIGFGSIVVEDPAALTRTVVDSVLKADVRCILSKGWSERLGAKDATKPEVRLPVDILQIKGAPHDWLFSQIDAAVHHGGSGTTGASLRAGIPTVIKPFFGDQYFFGARVEALGVGICLYKINVKVLAKALWEATNSQRLQVKARLLGEQIRKENGVDTAIQTIYRDLEYARTLSKRRNKHTDSGAADIEEETWTFVGDETDPELRKAVDDRGSVVSEQ